MTASVEFLLGGESVIVPLDITLDTETILTGDIDTVVAVGTTARLRGNCRLINNLHVRGVLKADPTGVVLDGNGFDIHTHDGGVLDLVGTEKSAWVHWGEPVVGWQTGDRLAVAPTATGIFVPSETTWQGSWAATTRPANSADVTLVDGSIAKPEVTNLSQTLLFKNMDRIMLHESTVPNVHTLKWLKVLDSGKSLLAAGELGHYPIHFHKLADTCRGSLLEGVVVEGGKLHAYVPHGSHGITFKDCVAYNTTDDAYWWDFPQGVSENNSNDIDWDHCLGMWVKPSPEQNITLSAFVLGAGTGNRCTDSVGTCVQGGKNASGFHWPSQANQDPNVWVFEDDMSHNNVHEGTFVWQNDPKDHVVERLTVYNVGGTGINHGAYRNKYLYKDVTITGAVQYALFLTANSHLSAGPLVFENLLTDGPLHVTDHHQPSPIFTVFRNCTFTSVTYVETAPGHPGDPSKIRYDDCGLAVSDFMLTAIHSQSVIEIWEQGVLMHRWTGGWS